MSSPSLNKTLTPAMLWGLGVGYVISGNYFGWNLGLPAGGSLGLAVAILFIIILALTFTFSYAELACAIPKAGGVFDYTSRAFGKDLGFLAGMAQNIEFIFAPPAIAFAIGAYINLFFPTIPVVAIAVLAYAIFTAINIRGITTAAMFELIVTIVAVTGLLIFGFFTLPKVTFEMLGRQALPNGIEGIFAAIPFAFWFFLGIEGVANVAEETLNPQRTILRGFGSAIVTLIILCVITFVGAVGVGGWERVVYLPDGTISDSPLPLAMALIVGRDSALYNALVVIGLFGLVASFNGIILAAGRSTFEFGRMRYAPAVVGRIHPRFRSPANALLVNMVIGILALLTGKTGDIITISVFGALTLYIFSSLTLLKLRRTEPELPRPFAVPLYPLFPIVAFFLASVSLIALTIYNPGLASIYFLVLAFCYAIFKWRYRP